MIDVQTMEIALKIAWVNRTRQNRFFSWKILIEHLFRQYGGFSFLLNCRYDLNLLHLNTVLPFYHAILKYWRENKPIISEDNIPKQNEIIWNNQNILINKHMIYLKHWHQSGITHIKNFLNEDHSFLSYDAFQQTFQLISTYYGLINVIPPSWRREIKSTKIPIENENVSQESSLPKSITTRSVYAAIINHYSQPPTAEPRLLRYGFSNDCLKSVYNLPFVITLETKLQIFQYKIIHNILPTKSSLFRMKLCESETCHLCKMQAETLAHLHYQCPVISKFWTAFRSWWFANHGKIITPTERDILFGWHDNAAESKHTLNYITLVAKYYIFCTTQDSDEVYFDGFPSFLKNKLDVLQQIAVKNKNFDNFNRKWKDFI